MSNASPQQIEKLTKAFHEIDKNGSGFIDRSELESAFGAAFRASGKPVDDAEVKRACEGIMKRLDKNNDDKVSLEEYIQYYTQSSLF